jgi:hypothetical protein
MSIEGTLFKSNYIGKDGFVWWIGRVADAHTWFNKNQEKSFSGEDGFRCKVRIIGYHPFDKTLKEEDLPWATVLMDASSGNITGNTQQLQGGETCVGFFLDGEDGQQPVIIGLLHRNANVKASTTPEENLKEQSSRFQNLPLNRDSGLNRNRTSFEPISPTTAKNGIVAKASDAVSKYSIGAKAVEACFAFEAKNTQTVVKPSTCSNDFIGRITQIIQDFIGGISILENTITGFINPLLNKVVDITSQIKSVANQIGGIVKLIINTIRSSLFKYITKFFRNFLGLNKKVNIAHPVVNGPAKKATKTIFQKIYCLLENLIDEIIDFIVNMLVGMIGKIVNPSFCVIEQFTSAILAKLMELIDNALQPILSGISWLTGGIGGVLNVLNQASTLAQQIFNFLGDCGSIKCTQPSKWISSAAAELKIGTDNWQKQLNNVNVLKGFTNSLTEISNAIGGDIQLERVVGSKEVSPGVFDVDYTTAGGNIFTRQEDGNGNPIANNQVINKNQLEELLGTVDTLTGGNSLGKLGSLEGAIAGMTMFGGFNSQYSQCNQSTFNPTNQNDLGPIPLGYKYEYCIPPIAEVVGSGYGASVIPIVGDDGGILAVEVIKCGYEYTNQTTIVIIDNSGHGSSARAKAIVNSSGYIESVVVLNPGSGYCKGDYSNITGENCADRKSGIGTTAGPGIGTTAGPGIGITTGPGIGTTVVGIVTDIYVVQPGLGYTSGDTINVGNCSYGLILTNNGSIIGINSSGYCQDRFGTNPIITINTNTGVGAKLKPVMRFVPQIVTINSTTPSKLINIVDCP